ncbi:hypothetical protein ACFL0V_06085 [Nanoarchaeota archaeon]
MAEEMKRQIAYKVKISEIMVGDYIREEGWQPNHIRVRDKEVSRVNLISVVVGKDTDDSGQATMLIDDGSGRVSLRFFDFPSSVMVGDIVNVVGRPREFGSERYVVPEIIRKVDDPKWVELRKMELAREIHSMIKEEKAQAKSEVIGGTTGLSDNAGGSSVIVNEVVEDKLEARAEDVNPIGKVFNAIKECDSGPGVGFDEIIVKTGLDEVDVQIKRLLEQGDIFEIKAGRYKVLE